MPFEISLCPDCRNPLPGVEIGGKPYCPSCEAKANESAISLGAEDIEFDVDNELPLAQAKPELVAADNPAVEPVVSDLLAALKLAIQPDEVEPEREPETAPEPVVSPVQAPMPIVSPPVLSARDGEEIRRLASMVGAVGYDEDLFKKGRLVFTCPLCHGRLETPAKKAGEELVCNGCTTEVVAPHPIRGLPAHLLHEGLATAPALPKAVLPVARTVQDHALAEGRAGGRNRKAAPVPSVDIHAPAAESGVAPIPARPDQVMGGAVLPKNRKDFGRGFFKKMEIAGALPDEVAPLPVAPRVIKAPPLPLPTRATVDEEFRAQAAPASQAPASSQIPIQKQRFNDKKKDFLPRQTPEGEIEVIQDWGVSERRAPINRKIAILAWVTVILGGIGAALWAMKEVVRDKTADELSASGADSKEDDLVNFNLAKEVVGKFFQAEKVAERAKYVRFPQLMEPRMHQHYGQIIAPLKMDRLEEPQELKIEGVNFLMADAMTSDGARHSVTLEIPEGNDPKAKELKIDWECLVGYSPMKWDEFLSKEPEQPQEFRVFIQPDDYDGKPFDDKSRYVCFKIQKDGTDKDYGFCYGYVDVQSSGLIQKLSIPMRKNLEDGGLGRIPCRLWIQFLPESKGRRNLVQQVRIVDFEYGWLVVKPPKPKE